ncbi:16S rRNA (cytosine(1402)-N(4))-methyltransferase, partial [candidate division CPR3 bacterium RIFOXYC2_FULL_35_7]
MHKPVLLKETIDLLKVQKGKQYIDCTFGFGGHSRKIIERDGKVLGIDVDEESISLAKGLFSHFDNLILVSDNFRNLKEIAKRNGIEKVSGILLDLGMSSWQIDCSGRGFSFTKNEPLDMRMDKSLKVTASDLIKVLNKGEFYDLLSRLGEEGCARD